ncbi:MAG: tRNA uridine-5-carboxymethylaminomethyl(34) synthesis GTPase MnmE, partial [Terriglobales bacterium]
MIDEETIAAISTPPGAGAIAIVRLSGPAAWQIVESIFRAAPPAGATSPAQLHPRTASHGFIDDADGAVLDEVVVLPYRGPHSYTGEDLIEIDCHGSPFLTHQILHLCLSKGARLARAGEFTQRAYLNGRMDLTQAEAVLDLVQAKTGRQSRQALSAMRGEVGGKIRELRTTLIELLSRVVAGIDFPEEVGDVPLDDVEDVVGRTRTALEQLALTVRSGRFLREGLRLAIVGKPNAGKSSLLNQLLKFDRAIVTDVPGTTRDSLEELIDVNGIPVILIDTAGIRDTEDQVEQIGIERTYRAVEHCDLALFVADVTTDWSDDDRLIAK